MRTILLAFLIGIMTFSFFTMDAQARRFGGGKSFGVTRQASSFSRAAPAAAAAQSAAKGASSTANKWLGPLAGLAAGGLLASLFMGHGMGGGILSWLVVGSLIYFGWRFMSSRRAVTQPDINLNYQAQNSQTYSAATHFDGLNKTAANAASVAPADFDQAAFLRQAKSMFIRLQAAYDAKNLADLREFTAPEVFAEIQLQLQERGNEPNQTDVLNIDAHLLDIATEAQAEIASVVFNGLVREEANAAPVSINETWFFRKEALRSVWVVAGIQQN